VVIWTCKEGGTWTPRYSREVINVVRTWGCHLDLQGGRHLCASRYRYSLVVTSNICGQDRRRSSGLGGSEVPVHYLDTEVVRILVLGSAGTWIIKDSMVGTGTGTNRFVPY
jgi:hypothetical protein